MTKEKFDAYENVRQDGKTNMFDVNRVILLAEEDYYVELKTEDCYDIMQNYEKYEKEYK